jgi:cytochrome c553
MLYRTLFCVPIALGLVACGGKTEPTPSPQAAEAPAQQAQPVTAPTTAPTANASSDDPKEVFKARCVMCHGADGKGDGPASVALNPKPRNYTDATWQKSVSDEQIKKTITGGGASVGKSPIMPAQPDLASKPEVLDGLVKIIRAFGGN